MALQTDEIAKLVVSNADEKEFLGKESVKAKVMTGSPEAKYTEKKISTQAVSPSKKASSQSSDENEWESF